MVITAGEAEKETQKILTATTATAETYDMATVPERSRSLHNFSTLPCFNVKWGRQMQLRCVKDSSESYHHQHDHFRRPLADHSGLGRYQPDPERKRRSDPFEPGFCDNDGGDDGGIEAMREKLMLDLRTEVHQMRAAILSEGGAKAVDTAAPDTRPWNLRTRRAVCKEPNNNGGASGQRKPDLPPAKHSEVKSPLRGSEPDFHGCGSGVGGSDGGGAEKGPRTKFSVSLSKKEIEEDFLAITGNRPARRPKKRPRHLQKQIDAVFPGFWLSEITADMYKVNEPPESGKR